MENNMAEKPGKQLRCIDHLEASYSAGCWKRRCLEEHEESLEEHEESLELEKKLKEEILDREKKLKEEILDQEKKLKEEILEREKKLKEKILDREKKLLEREKKLKEEILDQEKKLKEEILEREKKLKEKILDREKKLLEREKKLKDEILEREKKLKEEILEREKKLKEKILEREKKLKEKVLEREKKRLEREKKLLEREKKLKEEILEREKKLKEEILERKEEIESMKNRWTLEGLNKQMPILDRNDDLSPSEHKTNSNIKIFKSRNLALVEHLDFELNVCTENGESIGSVLLIEFDSSERPRLEVTNEASVHSYTAALVKDALSSLLCRKEISVYNEMSIFSLRPDILVVKHSNLGVVLTIEVKAPGTEEVYKSKHVAQQAYNYLMGMQTLGHKTPFAVITTFDSMVMCGLNDSQSHEEEYSKIVSKSFQLLKQNKGKIDATLREEDAAKGKALNSPGTKKNLISYRFPDCEDQNEDVSNEIFEEPSRAKITHSVVFESEHMLKAMVFAINCGILSLRDVNHKLRDFPRQGGTYINVKFAQVKKTSLSWKALGAKLDFEKYPHPICSTFFLLREIGQGRNGKVFLSSSYSGRICAIKFYLCSHKDWEGFSHKKRDKAMQASLKKCKEKAKEEARNHLYRSKLMVSNVTVSYKVLNNMASLQMPYFAPLPTPERTNTSILVQIFKHLLSFAENQYYYKEARWQHVGCYDMGNSVTSIILLDLESLLVMADVHQVHRNACLNLKSFITHCGLLKTDEAINELYEKVFDLTQHDVKYLKENPCLRDISLPL